MSGPTVDPLLSLIVAGRTLEMNNALRVKLVNEAAVMFRRDPEGFKAFVLQHMQWGQAEAIARDRCGLDVDSLPLLPEERQTLLLPRRPGAGR